MGRRLRVVVAAALALVVGAGACARDESEPTVVESSVEFHGFRETEHTVAIYAAVVRRLVTEDNTLGGGAVPFERVYVVDGVVEDAADPQAGWNEVAERFPPEVREGIADAVRELPPVRFVRDPEALVVNEETCARVPGRGVVISLGEIVEGDDERVEVANELYLGCLGAQWLTYMVEQSGEDWEVVGVTGPVEIV